MKLTSVRGIKNLFKKYHIHPSKRLGQNFLVNRKIIKKIIESAQLSPDDTVLEIGPGIGNLTLELAKRVKKVITIEKDPKMIEVLKELLNCWNIKNVRVIKGNVLNLKSEISHLKSYKIVANIPYYLTSPLIRKFLEIKNQPKEIILMVQKEVAQRICAKVPDMNLLAVSVQFYAKPEIISFVSKKSFWPQPKVDGAILKITPTSLGKKNAMTQKLPSDLFFRIVRAGFSQPRKQIVNNLTKMLKLNREGVKSWLLKSNIQPQQRAETLSVKDWINLTKTLGSEYER